jgi:hypothetical protein
MSAILRAKPGTQPTSPEQWPLIIKDARAQVLGDIRPILLKLAVKHDIIVISSFPLEGRTGILNIKFPGLDTGDYLCQISFELGVTSTGSRYSQAGYVSTGAIMYKTMLGPTERYLSGNAKRWTAARLPEIEELMDRFFATAKLFHEQRTALTTREPRVRRALEALPVDATMTATISVETNGKGLFTRIERLLQGPETYTKEVYLYLYEDNTLQINLVTTSGMIGLPISLEA